MKRPCDICGTLTGCKESDVIAERPDKYRVQISIHVSRSALAVPVEHATVCHGCMFSLEQFLATRVRPEPDKEERT